MGAMHDALSAGGTTSQWVHTHKKCHKEPYETALKKCTQKHCVPNSPHIDVTKVTLEQGRKRDESSCVYSTSNRLINNSAAELLH